MRYKYKYSTGHEFIEFSSECEFKERFNSTENYIAEDAANHCFENIGIHFPKEITVKTLDDKLIGKFAISMRNNPKFFARRI